MRDAEEGNLKDFEAVLLALQDLGPCLAAEGLLQDEDAASDVLLLHLVDACLDGAQPGLGLVQEEDLDLAEGHRQSTVEIAGRRRRRGTGDGPTWSLGSPLLARWMLRSLRRTGSP